MAKYDPNKRSLQLDPFEVNAALFGLAGGKGLGSETRHSILTALDNKESMPKQMQPWEIELPGRQSVALALAAAVRTYALKVPQHNLDEMPVYVGPEDPTRQREELCLTLALVAAKGLEKIGQLIPPVYAANSTGVIEIT